MDTLMSIKTFRQVIESGSFVAAAERLDMSTAMVSKHVMHIEKRLGVRLLNRNPRTLRLTEPGAVYFERCKTFLDGLHETEAELGSLSAVPHGTLRISAPTWFAEPLADMLASFRSATRRSWSTFPLRIESAISSRKGTISRCAQRQAHFRWDSSRVGCNRSSF